MDDDILTGSIFPVIAQVETGAHSAREKNRILSELSRVALMMSATCGRFRLNQVVKSEFGAPLPDGGVHWSVSHKDTMVAAVCAGFPVGIDIEKVVPRSASLLDYIACRKEWELIGAKDWPNFYRLFTAKEAASKQSGEGISALRAFRLISCPLPGLLILERKGQKTEICQLKVPGHIVSVTFGQRTEWKILDAPLRWEDVVE
ncbi:MAG: 4'-phosphopantetheinyl transferase superfamily protein [Candidatus Wallbacteria bacterium]|nr:4'-phosphopantetheinyl transferase superfamily protein [Candidatus Wallbacteria bacterium]